MVATRGFSTKEVILALIILLVAALIVFGIAKRDLGRQALGDDIRHMRDLYVGLSFYETDVDAQLAPDLATARPYYKSDASLVASGDPYAKDSGPFPADGSLPADPRKSPVRVSFGYLYSFVYDGKAKAKPWPQARFDSNLGLIADEWCGSVHPIADDFEADVSGFLLRLTADGSVIKINRPSEKPLGDVQDLFFRKP